jgi:transcriptional antiterminator Rof (Rho-off)
MNHLEFTVKEYGRRFTEDQMDSQEMTILHQKIEQGVKVAVAQALERHRKLGESIAVWRDGQVVTLSADQIPAIDDAQISNGQQETP